MITLSQILNANILIVDDKEADVVLLERTLASAGYNRVTSTTNSNAVYDLYRLNHYDLILLDLKMPSPDGFRVMESLKEIELYGYLPVLVITALPELKLRALRLGAKDVISKPFDLSEVLTRVHNMLEVRLLHRKSNQQRLVLERTLQELRDTGSELRATQGELSKEKAALSEQVGQLQQANQQLLVATLEAQSLAKEIELARIQAAHMAQHDALTDLPNRVLLNDRLAHAIDLARRHGNQFAVLFLDLDGFKHINDSLGHAVGDKLLQLVAKRLTLAVRSSDTVCRQGGDEFVILLAEIEHPEHAAKTAQKILAALVASHCVNQLDLHVTTTIGISIYPDDGCDADTLIKNADTAMYHAKASGRNHYQFFEQNMNIMAVKRQSIESGLRYGLERQEFVLHYQPKIDLNNGTIVGVEALIRWQHPEHGFLLPAQFVPVAEECGLIVPIGRWVLREACRQAQAWLHAGLGPITVAVNTSALEFYAKDFFESVRHTLNDTRLDPRLLEIELTESVLMRDAELTNVVLRSLGALGIKLAVDDFGTGYSSLSYLRQFPIDTLKIDQSFISQVGVNPDDDTIVSAVINMGKGLKRCVIAEGVETPQQYEFLRARQCDEAQGFYFGKPAAPEVLAKLLKTGLAPALLV